MTKSKAQNALEFVEQQVAAGGDAEDVHNAFFGNYGKFREWFPTRAEREAFLETPEYKKILEIQLKLEETEQPAS